MRRFWVLIAVLGLLCVCMGAKAAPSVTPSTAVTMFLNGSETFAPAQTGTTRVFLFTPAQTGSYLLYGFPNETRKSAPVYVRVKDANGRTVANATGNGGFRLETMLVQNQSYSVSVTSYSRALSLRIEIMASVFGHSFEQPTQLSGLSVRYNRAVVQPRDTHWYAFTAAFDGWYVIRSESVGGNPPDMRGALLDENGVVIEENDDVLFPMDGSFRLCARLNAGHVYYVRVSAASNETGSYRLVVAAPEKGVFLPAQATLNRASLTLEQGEQAALSLDIQPNGAQDDVMWLSEDSAVASVDSDGTVTGRSGGRTIIHAFTGRLELVCEVTVPAVPVASLIFAERTVTLTAGDTLAAELNIQPSGASADGIVWSSGDEAVVAVDGNGLLTAISEGETDVTAADSAGSARASLRVTVTAAKPVYRALVLGELNYETGRTRLGGLNTAQGVADMLARQSIDGRTYEVRLQMDSTREELLAAIAETFGGAKESDVSLFYINCHGDCDDEAWLELHDGTRVTAVQMEQLLRAIPGRIVVIMDCCRSGGFLGRSAAFSQNAQAAFARSPLASGKYVVLTSAGPDEDSYRRSFAGGSDEDSMATIMARALCEGAGWDLIGDRICTLKADADKDRRITVEELYLYVSRRVMYYLEDTGVTQTVCLWPEGDQTVLFQSARGGE